MPLQLKPRAVVSQKFTYLSPLIAVALTLIAGFFLFAFLGKDPFESFSVFFYYPVRDLYGIGELLLKATPLMLIAGGLAIGFRANIWNIGAEGQFIMGAVGSTAVALYFYESDSFLIVPLMMVAGAIGGMAWAAIPAFLKNQFNTNEILASLMLVYIAQLFVSWLVYGPMSDPDGFGFPQSKMFEEPALLSMLIEGTRLNYAFVFALSTLLVLYVFMKKSFIGFQIEVSGQAPHAAAYAGFSTKKMIWIGLLSGGGLAGIAGMTEVAGPMGQLTSHVSNNYGFAAIIVAFVARLNPIGIFFASLLMALLYLGGEQAQQYLGLPSSISNVFQGMLLLFLLGTDVLINYQIQWKAKVNKMGV